MARTDIQTIEPVLAAYLAKRTKETAGLVAKILADLQAYDEGLVVELAKAGAVEARAAIAALLEAHVPQPHLSDGAKAPRMTYKEAAVRADAEDAGAPPRDSLVHISHMRLMGVKGSCELYRLVCEAIAGVEEATVTVGMVKKTKRLAFKAAFKYGCVFGAVRDVNRCTVVVPGLVGVQAALEALLAFEGVTVVRARNRFAEGCDNGPIGGYCDLQLQVGFAVEGRFVLGEVQINVAAFVELKGREGGGHEIFDYARTIMAYEESTYKYQGKWSAQLRDMVAAGSILELDLEQGCQGIENVRELAKALQSETCRVTVL